MSKATPSKPRKEPGIPREPQPGAERPVDPGSKKSADKLTTATKSSRSRKASEGESSVKATFYLSQEAIDGLEEAWHSLRRSAEASARGAITKSLIVRLALEIALEEMRTHGAASPLHKRLEEG